jgi:hypothetical protein
VPRGPSPEHYIGYVVTKSQNAQIWFENGATVKAQDGVSVPDTLKDKTLKAVSYGEDGIILTFDQGEEVIFGDTVLVADPSYPEQEYVVPSTFSPETPDEPERD